MDLNIQRRLNVLNLLKKKSHFLFGARGTGKTTLIHQQLLQAHVIDLLEGDTYSLLLRRPAALETLIPGQTSLVVVDEIQKIPALLDEVHRLIESRSLTFLLTGSSARKLKRGAANLLGGRAWEAHLYPLTSYELKEKFNLTEYLNRGGLPFVYFSEHPDDELKNYALLYLKEEVQAEALVKRLDHFSRFLDISALYNGEEQNFENIANDSGVPARTVASYFEILEDTLLGFRIQPFKSQHRKAVRKSKFYFFDVGVAGAVAKRGKVEPGSELYGKALEHFIAQELRAFIDYTGLDEPLQYWRTVDQREVDFIVGDRWAFEVKATSHVGPKHLKSLVDFSDEGTAHQRVIVSNDPVERTVEGIRLLPVSTFLQRLWAGNAQF